MRSNIKDLEVIYQTQTEKAICVRETEDSKDIWIPLSMCEIEPRPGEHLVRGRVAILTCEEDTLMKKGLI